MIHPIVRKPPGASMNISAGVKFAGAKLILNTDPLPRASLIAPNTVRDKVNPSPDPIPSIKEANTPFFDAKLSALPNTIQLTTIRGINNPNTL